VAAVVVDPDAVAAAGARVGAAGAASAVPAAAPVGAAAPDPVSMAAIETLSARIAAVNTHLVAAEQITRLRAAQLESSAAAYKAQEAANQGGLGLAAPPPAQVAPPPIPAIPITPITPTVVPPPMPGPPPGDATTLATLVHSGSLAGLNANAAQLRAQASELAGTADQLRANAGWVENSWRSAAGDTAATRLRELALWYDEQAEHTTSAAAAFETAADNHRRAQAAIPTPAALVRADQRLAAAKAAVAANPRYLPVVPQLQAQRDELRQQALTGYNRYHQATATANLHGTPVQPPPQPRNGSIQAVDHHTFKQEPQLPGAGDPKNMTEAEARAAYAALRPQLDEQRRLWKPVMEAGAAAQYNARSAELNATKAALEARLRELGVTILPEDAPVPANPGPPDLPSTPTGQSGSPMDVPPGTNVPETINGTPFSGHALDQMQGRGIPLSVVENALQNGLRAPTWGDRTIIYDPANHISVVQAADGTVITVIFGDRRP
jgi:Domain of unknown function (DUF4258)